MKDARISMLVHFSLIQFALSSQGVVTYVQEKARSFCPSVEINVFTVPSQIHCVHRCMQEDKCNVINYRLEDHVQKNCEVLSGMDCVIEEYSKWRTITVKKERKKVEPKVFKSCKELLGEKGDAKTGVYELESGRHFCNMGDVPGCGGGGWTLAMEMNGMKKTFAVDSSYWSNEEDFNTEEGLDSTGGVEAKYPAFSKISFAEICVGMMTSDLKWLKIPVSGSSLLDLFRSGAHVPSGLGQSAWNNLAGNYGMPCNAIREGINVKIFGNIVSRIGFASNVDGSCAYPSYVSGLGTRVFACGTIFDGVPINLALGFILIK